MQSFLNQEGITSHPNLANSKYMMANSTSKTGEHDTDLNQFEEQKERYHFLTNLPTGKNIFQDLPQKGNKFGKLSQEMFSDETDQSTQDTSTTIQSYFKDGVFQVEDQIQLNDHEDFYSDLSSPLFEYEKTSLDSIQEVEEPDFYLQSWKNISKDAFKEDLNDANTYSYGLNSEMLSISKESFHRLKKRGLNEQLIDGYNYFILKIAWTIFKIKVFTLKARFYVDYEEKPQEREEMRKELKKNLNIQNLSEIIMPLNINRNHWAFIRILPGERKILYYDSVKQRNVHAKLANIKSLFDEIIGAGFQVEIDKSFPSQYGGVDCGIFMLMGIKKYAWGIKSTFSQENMPRFRQLIREDITAFDSLIPSVPAQNCFYINKAS